MTAHSSSVINSASYVRGLGVLPLSLPAGSELFMDSGYTDYAAEDAARLSDGIEFAPSRKGNSKRGDEVWRSYYKQLMRKRIETVFSQITNLLPKHIHAVTLDGFLLAAKGTGKTGAARLGAGRL